MHKKLILPVSIVYTITLTAFSLIKINTPGNLPSNSDKLFHTFAYVIFTTLWFLTFYYIFKLNKIKALIISALFSTVFGTIIEFLQGGLTTNREADLFDVIANTIGTLIAIVVITAAVRGVKK